MVWTIIIKMGDGTHHVGVTDNIKEYMKVQRAKTEKGYFHHKKNRGDSQVVFVVKGNHKTGIKRMNCKSLLTLFKDYDPVNDALNQLLLN